VSLPRLRGEEVSPADAFAREKLDHMEILGARLQIVPSEDGRMTVKLTRDMVEAARVIAERTGVLDGSAEERGLARRVSRYGHEVPRNVRRHAAA
jgi:hypothetical protein